MLNKSHLFQLINAFSSQEKKEIRHFLDSPYFNHRRDVSLLFDALCRNEAPEKQDLKIRLFGSTDIQDQELRLRMTYLMRLLEQYIAQKEFDAGPNARQQHLLRGLRKRGLPLPFERAVKQTESLLEKAPKRDTLYYETRFHLYWENYQFQYASNPTDAQHLRAAYLSADLAYISLKLRLICLQLAHQSLYAEQYQALWEAEVVQIAERYFAKDHPSIAIYLHCYRMMRESEEESHFLQFKSLLLTGSHLFSEEETRGLYIWAINYCIRNMNTGKWQYAHELVDLYKPGLEHGYLMENGVLSQYSYHNAVAVGLHTGDHTWVNHIIHHFKNSLERPYRESAFSFNLARLEFARQNYDAVLNLVQQSNYRDVLVNLATKALLLKTYYEIQAHDLLQSHLDAMLNYIRRKRVIGYHRTNYTNIVRLAYKLLSLQPDDKKAVALLRTEVELSNPLTEKEWFLGKLRPPVP